MTLLDIEGAARLVLTFVGDMTQDAFLNDPKTKSSVIYQLLVIGEAVKRLSVEFRSAHDNIPWSAMAGMRDHLIHAYDTVDWDAVWTTAMLDVPNLLDAIQPLRPTNGGRQAA